MNKKISNFFAIVVNILALLFCSVILIKGLCSWVIINSEEQIFLVKPSLVNSVFGIVVALFIIVFIYFAAEKINISSNGVFWTVFFVGLVWVLATQVAPRDDAEHCLMVAEELNDGILNSFNAGQYLDTHRVNSAYILFMLVVTKLFGNNNYIAFQLINIVLFSFTNKKTYEIISEKSKLLGNMVFLTSMIYCPIWLFVTYIYGNMVGISLGILGLIYQQKYFENEKIKYALLESILIALSCAMKGIFYIFLIAMIIMHVWSAIDNKRLKKLQPIIFILIFMLTISKLFTLATGLVSKGTLREEGGNALTSIVVMGTDMEEDMTNPGWYTGYTVQLYERAGYNKAKATELCKGDTEILIAKIKQDPMLFVSLLSRKNHTIWNDPTYDYFHRNAVNADSSIRRNSLINSFLADSGKLHKISIIILRSLQLWIFAGIIIYITLVKPNIKSAYMVGLVSFIGAYIFFTLWEGKSEYVLAFFMLLIIYSMQGYVELFGLLRNSELKSKAIINKELTAKLLVIVLSIVMVVVIFPRKYNNREWDEYLKNHYYVTNGNYSLVLNNNDSIGINNIYISFEEIYGNWTYVIYDNDNRYYYKFLNWDPIDTNSFDRYYASEQETVDTAGDDVLNGRYYDDHWIIQKENGGYIIRWFDKQNKVWTYDEHNNQIILADYDEGNENQVWSLK